MIATISGFMGYFLQSKKLYGVSVATLAIGLPITVALKNDPYLFSKKPDDFYVSKSTVHGQGMFTSDSFKAGDVVCDAYMPLSNRYVNHSTTPNTVFEMVGGKVMLVAVRDIQVGDEITVNYDSPLNKYRNAYDFDVSESGCMECDGIPMAMSVS